MPRAAAIAIATTDEVSSTEEPPPLAAVVEDGEATAAPCASLKLSAIMDDPQWGDWRWQMRNRIRTVPQLREFFPSLKLSPGLSRAASKFPLAITPYYASLMRELDPRDPVFGMAVPQIHELFDPPFLVDDPLEEDHDMPVPGLVHRYPDRALLIATTTCAMYCRHCTRKRAAGHRESCITDARLKQVVAYLMSHPEISDVIVSGGDPFTMATELLDRILTALRSVPSIDIIRIGTRTIVTMPMRVTDALVAVLRKHQPVYVNTHFNHPNEITPESSEACRRLVDAGVPMGNQMVLLRGINDDPRLIETLCRRLVKMRVRPYYLFQCDLVRGVEHFRTPLSRGIQIMEYLRGRLSGLAIPSFVVDAPHGGGKIPVLPTYLITSSPTHTVLRNFEGLLVSYPEPLISGRGNEVSPVTGAPMVFDLTDGSATKIQPADTAREKRRATYATCDVPGIQV